MPISVATVDAFVPDADPWVPIGAIGEVRREQNTLLLRGRDAAMAIRLSILSPTCLRLRFGPAADGDEPSQDLSHAVVHRDLGHREWRIITQSADRLAIEAGSLRLEVDLHAFALRVLRGTQLVCADPPGGGLAWRPGAHGVAGFKRLPSTAHYCGFGEKAGERLLKNGERLTNFNFDNFIYARAPLPEGEEGGPLNPAEPLYASIPLLIEINPAPEGDYAGSPYAYGLFLDNVSQSFFDVGHRSPDRYAFGALFGTLDYYLMIGDGAPDVLRQFTELTGRSAMPPLYAFGFHQGCYGYFDRSRLEAVARAYRAARIPIDGLHIDIDLQDNYRVFTHSEKKFPDAAGMIADLHAHGFKCATNVTPMITANPLDETGAMVPFAQRQDLLEAGYLLYDVRAGQAPSEGVFTASISYGANRGINPYSYPPLVPNRDGVTPLGAEMNYPDLGRPEVRAAWGGFYAHLVNDLGIDMIWQDMTCPAASVAADTPDGTLPLDLMVHDGARYVPHAVCHNAYAQFLLQATHEGLARLRPEIRPFILARGGYAGLQRYAALWTGDNASSWDFLRITVPQVLSLGLSGVPLSGADVGGFATGPIPEGTMTASSVSGSRVLGGITDPELFVRWMQAGSFLPWFRNHYIGYDKEYQEAYAYGEPVAAICRRWIELRYRMLPIYYDAMYEYTLSGMPIARALFLNDPHDAEVYRHLNDQFFIGHDLLVAPILHAAANPGRPATRDVYLPAGSSWYPFEDGAGILTASIDGGLTLRDVPVGLDQVPVYVRAGAILPLRSQVEQFIGDLAENPLEIRIYPGPNGEHVLYQDDGTTMRAATRGAYRATRISRTAMPRGTRIRIQRLHDGYSPPERCFFVRLPGSGRPSAVGIDGTPIAMAASASALGDAATHLWLWDARTQSTVVKLFDDAPDVNVELQFRD